MSAAPHSISTAAPQPSPEHLLMPLRINGLHEVLPGLSRGTIAELTGAASSGRASLVQAFLAGSTTLGEVSAVVDASNSFDPASAERAGVDLKRLLWVQCNGRLDHAMKAADMLLHGGGFGLVVLDLCEVTQEALRRIPISYWHRFRLAVQNTSTAFVVAGNQANARSCAAQQIELEARRPEWMGCAPFQRLNGLHLGVHSRKPMQRETAGLMARSSGE
jgi:hypothetical protein